MQEIADAEKGVSRSVCRGLLRVLEPRSSPRQTNFSQIDFEIGEEATINDEEGK
jgi:hypothetical protein